MAKALKKTFKVHRFVKNTIVKILSVVNRILIVFIWLSVFIFIAAFLSDMFIFSGYFRDRIIDLFLVNMMAIDFSSIFNIIAPREILYFAGVLLAEILVKLLLDVILKKIMKECLIKSLAINIVDFAANCLIAVQALVLFASIMIAGYFGNMYKKANPGEEMDFSRQSVERLGTYLLDTQSTGALMLKNIMDEIENRKIDIEKLNDTEYRNLALNICGLFEAKGNVAGQEEHYLRNIFSRAPETLCGMIEEIQKDNKIFKWKLLAPDYAVLHTYGEDGEYNIKFISEDGHFEAVYNKEGILLTQYNDPLNMGTFNYADQVYNREKHSILDVLPYVRWGNTANGASPLDSEPSGFEENPGAAEHYNRIYKMIYGEDYENK